MIWTHVSELAIDRLLGNELAPEDAAAVLDHASSCARCSVQLQDALAIQRTFAAERPKLAFIAPRRRPRYVAMMTAATALAASVAVAFAWPRHGAEGIRTKGTAIVGFFVAHHDQVRRGATREPVVAGDRIELVTTSDVPAWFAAISTDGAATRTVYVAPRQIAAGPDRAIDTAIELDASPGVETVTGVFCETAFDALAIDLNAPPPGCTLDHFALVKVAR